MRTFFNELPADFVIFIGMAVIWLIVGLGLRRTGGKTPKQDLLMKVGGTFFAVASVPIFLGALLYGFTGAATRTGFKNRLESVVSVPYTVSVGGEAFSGANARTIVTALRRTYGAAASHSGPTDAAEVTINSAAGEMKVTIRDDSLSNGALWLFEPWQRGDARQIGRIDSPALRRLLFGEPYR